MGMLEEIGDYLQGQGFGTQATDLFIGEVPQNAPDTVVGVLETSGLAPTYTHGIDGPTHLHPMFQIYSRDQSYNAASVKAHNIFKSLGRLQNVALNGTWYLSVRPRQNPFSIGRDLNHGAQIVCNYEVVKVPSA